MLDPVDPKIETPTTAKSDTGAVAARLLGDESRRGRDEMPVLGPEDLSMGDMGAVISDALGRKIGYHQVTFDAFKEQLLGRAGRSTLHKPRPV